MNVKCFVQFYPYTSFVTSLNRSAFHTYKFSIFIHCVHKPHNYHLTHIRDLYQFVYELWNSVHSPIFSQRLKYYQVTERGVPMNQHLVDSVPGQAEITGISKPCCAWVVATSFLIRSEGGSRLN